jgi:hypothetical protein
MLEARDSQLRKRCPALYTTLPYSDAFYVSIRESSVPILAPIISNLSSPMQRAKCPSHRPELRLTASGSRAARSRVRVGRCNCMSAGRDALPYAVSLRGVGKAVFRASLQRSSHLMYKIGRFFFVLMRAGAIRHLKSLEFVGPNSWRMT